MIENIQLSELLDDFLNESKRIKAHALYFKCRKAGKYKLADRIMRKYRLPQDDMIVAFEYMLLASKTKLS